MTTKILNFLKKIFLFLPFVFIFACHPTKQIDFNSREAFFKSLERPEIKKNEKAIVKNDSLEKDLKSDKLNRKELAEKIGQQIAKRSIQSGIKDVAFDKGKYKYHGIIKILAEAARNEGLNF